MTASIAAGANMVAPFVPFELKWDAPQLTEAELSRNSAVEWWYFDLSTTDGVELVVIFGRKNPMWSAEKASVYIEYKDQSTSFHRVHNYERSQFSWTSGHGVNELKIGPNSVKIVGDDESSMHYEILIDEPGIQGTLTMKPDHRGFLPTFDGCYFRGKNDASLKSCVSFSAPLMTVSGTLGLTGNPREVTGVGYHDHPWATEQFFWTHNVWHWGRATSAESNVMFATV
ncbi:MAG: lipocalin-like domain-containing protein, partial [Gemmatimonadaceae bacterium]